MNKRNTRNRKRNNYRAMIRRLMRKPARGGRLVSKITYQYRQNTQRMGPGYTTRNIEEQVGIQRNALQIYDFSTFALKDDLDSLMRNYKYVRIAGVLVTQNRLNMTDEQNCVYVSVDWSSQMEDIADIENDDATKILPNLGTKTFVFVPPRAQLPTLFDNQTIEYIRIDGFTPCQTFYQAGQDNYRLPGRIGFYNTTDSPRIVRVILRLEFRGSRVIDKEEEAKRYLKKKGYEIGEQPKIQLEAKFKPVITKEGPGDKDDDPEVDEEELKAWQ